MKSKIWILGFALATTFAGGAGISHAAPGNNTVPFVRQFSSIPLNQAMQVKSNYCEFRVNPEGMDVIHPPLSWVLASGSRGDGQTAYQIIVASSPSLLAQNKGDLWDSGKQVSTENTAAYQGRKLASRQKCHSKVRVWNSKGRASSWGNSHHWSMGLLNDSD